MTTQTHDQILYLCTSTAPQYIKDTLDLLSLPSGISYRFRYDLNWLSPTLYDNDKLKPLTGMNVLLVHVRATPITKSGEIPKVLEFIPIREAKILETKLVGDFLWVHFLLGDWIAFETTTKNSPENEHHNAIKDVMPTLSKTEYKYTTLLAEKTKIPTIKENLSEDYEKVISNWSTIVAYLSSKDEHQNSIFIKLLEIKNIDIKNKSKSELESKLQQKLEPKELADMIYGFELESGKTYQIDILQRYYKETPKNPFNLEIVTNPHDVFQVKRIDKIQSKYDVLRFIITAATLEQTRHSFLMIQPENNAPKEFKISNPFYNLKVKVKKKKFFALLLFLGIGVALAGFGNILSDPSKNLTPLTIALPIGGGIITSLMVYFLPKK